MLTEAQSVMLWRHGPRVARAAAFKTRDARYSAEGEEQGSRHGSLMLHGKMLGYLGYTAGALEGIDGRTDDTTLTIAQGRR